jgi:hypothetical protein
MPYGDPDPQDPNMLVGVPVDLDREAVREMAYAFAEEYASLGYDEKRLLALFREPSYSGPHLASSILGEGEIRSIVSESVGRWGGTRVIVHDPEAPRAIDVESVGLGGGNRQSTVNDQEGE